jgi:hypothetical protein
MVINDLDYDDSEFDMEDLYFKLGFDVIDPSRILVDYDSVSILCRRYVYLDDPSVDYYFFIR